jgi:hypothetical protein
VDFKTPFLNQLQADNRWIQLSQLIPWAEFEETYQSHFGSTGNTAVPFRVALGSLIIKERLGLTDEETVEQIRENPYLQYFIGYPRYRSERPFDASSMTHFRKRISMEMLLAINERICQVKKTDEAKPAEKKDKDDDDDTHKGKLIIDATCAPEDMRHPNDVLLLSESRELTEQIIDTLWGSSSKRQNQKKPRTYRENARKDFLRFIRKRNRSMGHIRKGLRKQLNYLGRNLSTIEEMKADVSLSVLDKREYKKLLVAQEVYRQQQELYMQLGEAHRSIPDRIVSLCKPHVRPIVRGKAAAKVEYGAKLSVSVIDGKTYLDKLSWDAYNESGDLKDQLKEYKTRTGYYPKSIHADKIYRNRWNLRLCRKLRIRLSGVALGRPPASDENRKERLRVQRADEIDRIEIEGRFGTAKRRYGLSRIMTKLAETSEHAIALVFVVMNLDKILRDLLLRLFRKLFERLYFQFQVVVLAA